MKFCNGLGFSGCRHIRFVHIDVIALTLGRPEPYEAFPLQASVVDHFVEHPLRIVKDSPSLQTCRKQRLWTSDTGKLSQATKFCSSVPILWRHTGTLWIELWIKQMNGCMNYFKYELCCNKIQFASNRQTFTVVILIKRICVETRSPKTGEKLHPPPQLCIRPEKSLVFSCACVCVCFVSAVHTGKHTPEHRCRGINRSPKSANRN